MIDPSNHIISKSLLAGIVIGVGCYLYLLSGSTLIGSFLLSCGFILCYILDLNLFTDKSGFLSDNNDFRRLVLVLLLNVISVYAFSSLFKYLDPSIVEISNILLMKHLDISYTSCIAKATVAGFLITLAIKQTSKQFNFSSLAIYFICIFGLIYTDCFHCITELFYYGYSSILYDNLFDFVSKLGVIILFNFIGSCLFNLFINKSITYR